MGQTTHDASQELRANKIDRAEAIALVKQYDAEFPKKYFKDFLDYINISEEKFWQITDNHRSPHLWEKKDKKWKLKYEVV